MKCAIVIAKALKCNSKFSISTMKLVCLLLHFIYTMISSKCNVFFEHLFNLPY